MKAGVPESRPRREIAKVLDEAKEPVAKAKLSLLARLIRSPNKANAQALVKAASQGELTTHDMQAGIAALIACAGEEGKKAKSADNVRRNGPEENTRAYLVLQKQLVEGLKDVVLAAPSSGGPLVVVELHWPVDYTVPDQGEAVRTKVPEGMVV